MAADAERAETDALSPFSTDEVAVLRKVLFALIDTSEDPVPACELLSP